MNRGEYSALYPLQGVWASLTTNDNTSKDS